MIMYVYCRLNFFNVNLPQKYQQAKADYTQRKDAKDRKERQESLSLLADDHFICPFARALFIRAVTSCFLFVSSAGLRLPVSMYFCKLSAAFA